MERLALAALVWTGEGSPTLIKRAERIDEWRASNRRVVDESTYQGIFSRDVTGLTIPAVKTRVHRARQRMRDALGRRHRGDLPGNFDIGTTTR